MTDDSPCLWEDMLVPDMRRQIASHLDYFSRWRLAETSRANWEEFRPRPMPTTAEIVSRVRKSNQAIDILWWALRMGATSMHAAAFRAQFKLFVKLDLVEKILNSAIQCSDMALVDTLLAKGWRFDWSSINDAIRYSSLEMVKWLPATHRLHLISWHAEVAVRNDRMDILEWLINDQHFPPAHFALHYALHAGKELAILEQVYALVPGKWGDFTLSRAIECYDTRFDVLDWLVAKQCPSDPDDLDRIARGNTLTPTQRTALEWLLAKIATRV